MNETVPTYDVMLDSAKRESDRGCALVLASNLENCLRFLLEGFFVEESSKRRDSLFNGNGCLANFSSRIKLTYAVGLIGKDERHDLDIIRRIRNNFAHSEYSLDFTEQSVNKRCNSLRLYKEMLSDRPEIGYNEHSGRDIFQIVSVSLYLNLADRIKNTLGIKRITPPSMSILPIKNATSE